MSYIGYRDALPHISSPWVNSKINFGDAFINTKKINVTFYRRFESRWMSIELIYYLCQNNYCFFINFTTSFVGGILWWTKQPCYNNLFQFMQHDNFRNLNRVTFACWKHLEFRVNAFWCFPVIKRYTFHYLMKSAPISGHQNSFEYCNCSIHGVVKV